jgi:hypothetical protein
MPSPGGMRRVKSARFASKAAPRHEKLRNPPEVPRLLRLERPPDRGVQFAGAARRPDAAVHQRRDEPVQGCLPRLRQAQLQPRARLRRNACAPAASTTTWKTSATPRATTPSSRCWATSASATISSATPSSTPGNCWSMSTSCRQDKLWVTVYAEDDEAYDIWTKEIGVPAERVIRIGDNKGARYASDNFWMMGDTGPCGPCTEIFYDHGEHIWGGPPGLARRGRRPLHRDLEQRLHAVQPRRGTASCIRCPSPRSIPAWASSASRRCCRACMPTTKSTCSRR